MSARAKDARSPPAGGPVKVGGTGKKAGRSVAQPIDEDSFEVALEALEALVENLEGGGHTLEDSLESFEQGVRLVRVCSERLRAARLRLLELEQGPGGLKERELELEESE